MSSPTSASKGASPSANSNPKRTKTSSPGDKHNTPDRKPPKQTQFSLPKPQFASVKTPDQKQKSMTDPQPGRLKTERVYTKKRVNKNTPKGKIFISKSLDSAKYFSDLDY